MVKISNPAFKLLGNSSKKYDSKGKTGMHQSKMWQNIPY